jgi:hypothetical protein
LIACENCPEGRDSKIDALWCVGHGCGRGLVEVVKVVEGADDGGYDGKETREFEEEGGEALLEGVWGDKGT